jgi:hypothetical protein
MEKRLSFFEKLRNTVGSKLRDLAGTATIRVRDIVSAIGSRNVSGNQIMNDRKRLINTFQGKHLGKMCMFFYDPKYKETLAYYDRFPLVIPIEFHHDGFIGLNLHYLPHLLRARLMDSLYDRIYGVSNAKDIDENKRTRVTYAMLKTISKNKLFVPCTKKYLYQHLSSRIYILDPNDWEIAIYVPSERFVKSGKKNVWQESINKIRNS